MHLNFIPFLSSIKILNMELYQFLLLQPLALTTSEYQSEVVSDPLLA